MQKLIIMLTFILGVHFSGFSQWEEKNIMTNTLLTSVDFLDDDIGYVVGGNKIYKTESGGDNWEEVYLASDLVLLEDIFIIDGEKIIAAGIDLGSNQSVIIKTENGGINWKLADVQNSSFLKSIHFPTPSIGFCSGVEGTILKSIDSGNTWNALNSGIGLDLHSIVFINDLIGIAVGGSPSNSVILKTQDGGYNWSSINSPTENNLQSTYFINQEVGYIVGWNGEIIKTINCGDTWLSLASVSMSGNLEVLFTDDNTGYIVGGQMDESLIQKTTNGGELWEDISPPINEGLISINFPSFNVGYAVGENGTIVKTKSGEVITSTQNLELTSNINFFPNPVNEELFIESKELEAIGLIRIYDTRGKLAKEINLNSNQASLDFSNFESNVYYIEVRSENGISINKIVKK